MRLMSGGGCASHPLRSALPFLKNVEVLLYPVAVVLLVYIVALSMRWSISMSVFRWYGFENPSAWL